MGNERDYDSDEYKKDKQRYPEYVGGSSKLNPPKSQWMEFKPAVPPPPGYYYRGMIQEERERVLADNPFYQARLEREKQEQEQSKQGNSTKGQHKTDSDTKPQQQQNKQGFWNRMFGGGKEKSQQPEPPTPTQAQAREQFDKNAPPGLKPDVYIGQLQLQRQLAKDNGATEKELKKIDGAIANAEKLLGVTEQTPEGTAIPLKAALVPTADPTAVPLQLYLKPTENGGWAIVDLTNPDPGAARTYEGKIKHGGRQADKVEGEAAKQLAIDRAWENYIKNNPHPAGELVADLATGNKDGSSNIKQAHSDGVSELGKVRNWASRAGLVSGVVGIGLLLTPGAQGAGALILGSAIAGGVAGSSNILDRKKHGNFQWDTETFLDITDIAGGLAVGAGSAIRIGAKTAKITQLGKNTVLISEGVETGTDVAAGTIISAQHYRRIEEIRNSDLPEGEKKAQIQAKLASASATGGLILLGGVASSKAGRAGRTRDFDFDPDGITSLNRGTKNSAELNKWRRIGLDDAEIAELNDASTTKARKDALAAKNDAAYKQLYEQYGKEGLAEFDRRLGADGFKKIRQASGKSGLDTVADVIELEKQGKITGFDDWVTFFNRSNAEDANLADVIGELSVAKQTAGEIRQGEVVNVGGDARAATRADGGVEKSFDLTVENEATGEVVRNIEVESVRNTVEDGSDLLSGVGHAASKAKEVEYGTVEAAIRVDLPEPGSMVERPNGKERYFGRNGRYTEINPETKTTDPTGRNTFAGEKSVFEGLEQSLSRSNDPQLKRVDRVTVIDKSGTTVAILHKQRGGQWKLENVR